MPKQLAGLVIWRHFVSLLRVPPPVRPAPGFPSFPPVLVPPPHIARVLLFLLLVILVLAVLSPCLPFSARLYLLFLWIVAGIPQSNGVGNRQV